MRGHGDSGKPSTGYTFPDLAEDLSEFIKTLNLVRPLIVGHSAGGSAAIIAHAFEPGLLGPSLIIDSRVGGNRELSSRPEMKDRPSRTRRKRLIWDSREVMREAYRDRSVFRSWNEEIFDDYINGCTKILADGRSELKCAPETEATLYEQRTSLNTSPYLNDMKADILLLLGNYSGAQTLDDAGIQEFLNKVEGSQVRISPMGSHFLPMEYPKLVLTEIEQFIKHH
jgi:pimeloyl-ACP methyl ester carboxylesterase